MSNSSNASETKGKLEDDIDALFALSLTEFTGARNALAARLKQGGHGAAAARVKALVKPSISAWAVNQLYWKHRKAFDRLMEAGQRLREAQASQLAGKVADTRGPHDERRETLSELSRLAAALLRATGHNATSDTMRRVTTTLEAMSVYASSPDAPPRGHLTNDVSAPGFEALAALIQKSASATTNSRKGAPVVGIHGPEETRHTRIGAAKVSLQNAERVLSEVRARAQGAKVALKRANANAKEAEKQKLQAEERFQKASAASQEAGQRAHSVAVEAERATRTVEDAERAVKNAFSELQSLLSKLPARG